MKRERVILVHGMGRTALSMAPLGAALIREGFAVRLFGYPSRSTTVARSSRALAGELAEAEAEPGLERIHLVGHSLGNILIRAALLERRPTRLGRVVMLAPPNQGARKADELAGTWVEKVLRPIGELTTHPENPPRKLGTPHGVEIGIIAGDKDGKVQVEETHLAGAKEHIVVRSGHTFIMARPTVQRLVLRFLREGSF